MHLKSCPKLCVGASRVRGTFVGQQGGLLRTLTAHHGNIGSSRVPLSIICASSTPTTLWLKAPPDAPPRRPPSPPGSPDAPHLTEDPDAGPNVWTVIRPGHVRQKIAIFSSEGGRAADGRGAPTAGTAGPPAAGMPRAGKAKYGWEETSTAKRRRRSTANQAPRRDGTGTPEPAGEGEGPKLSVVEMVAFLEQRAGEQQPELKPAISLQRSSAAITLTKAPPTRERLTEAPPTYHQGEGLTEAPPISDKADESDNIRVSEMVARLESECLRRQDGVSRSNSLKRAVGRVLLAGGAVTSSSSPPLPSSAGAQSQEEPAPPPPARLVAVGDDVTEGQAEAPPPLLEEAEPPPGLLFLSPPPQPPHYRTSLYLEPARAPASPPACQEVAVAPMGQSTSPDFLERRRRLQRLLAPPPFLLTLPHHLLLHILLLLPTRSLAALKCSCAYFKFIIETYGVRPADALWVSDPRYRDDPCKQCKRRYGPGDVSLCRWHHKPYCQALPYGPGYWMCCHGARRDAPGCNVGLHDNRWVPSFHSVPIYRRNCNHDD